MDESIGPAAESTLKWGKSLAERSKIPVVFVDERLSSFTAEQQLSARKRDGERLTRKGKKKQLDSLAAATFLSVKARLARALLNVADYVGKDNGDGQIELRLKIGQGDLAAMAGVARENVSRTMSDWRKRIIVTRSSSYYCINDPAALAQEMSSRS
jgi:CRP-like cAMP-binding protein